MPAPAIDNSLFPMGLHEFALFRSLIHKRTGIWLRDGKQVMLASRLLRRLRHHRLASFADYYSLVQNVQDNGEEIRELINCVTTNKTSFFRERHHFEFLANTVVPAIQSAIPRGASRAIRVWSAASSTGEEAYSIVITLLEALHPHGSADGPAPIRDGTTRTGRSGFPSPPVSWKIEVIASDIDTKVLETAQRAIYKMDSLASVAPPLIRKYFLRGKDDMVGQVKVKPVVTRLVEFKRINLNDVQWPLDGLFDVIFFRNALIYFNRETQIFSPQNSELSQAAGLSFSRQRRTHLLAPRHSGTLKSHHVSIAGCRAMSVQANPNPRPAQHCGAVRDLQVRSDLPGAAELRAPAADRARPQHRNRVSLYIGEVAASRSPIVLDTLLGSCVAVCLYDPVLRAGGMNHILLPRCRAGDKNPRCGIHAMELLINELMKIGADRKKLVAKAFGGASVLEGIKLLSIGNENAKFVREFLATEKIPLVAERLGGTHAVHLYFRTDTGRATVHTVDGSGLPKIVNAERLLSKPPVSGGVSLGEIRLY